MGKLNFDRTKLIKIILTLPEFSSGRVEDIRTALFNAGLERFRDGVDLSSGIPRTKIGTILERLVQYDEPLPDYPDYYPLGLFLKYILIIEDLKLTDAQFVAKLIIKGCLTSDEEFLTQLYEQYSIPALETNESKINSQSPKNVHQIHDHHVESLKSRQQDGEEFMKLTELRNILADFYPDDASMRRIIYDSGLKLPQILLNSTPQNNWHSILSEAQKTDQLDDLLKVVNQEYGTNILFQHVYNHYRKIKPIVNFTIQNEQKLNWPLLWRTMRPLSTTQVDNWWRAVRLAFNPFGPEQAERDPDLPKRAVYPDVLHECLSSRRTTIIFGATGSGKTACARLLAYSCIHPESGPPEAKSYPVLHTIPTNAENQEFDNDLSKVFAFMLARSLVPFFTRNVEQFGALPDNVKLATAFCLVHGFGSTSRVKTQFRLDGMKDNEEHKQLWNEIIALIQDVQPYEPNSEEWLHIFAIARPFAFEQTYLIIDVAGRDGQEAIVLAKYLQSLIEYWMKIEVSNVYLKLLLPDSIQPHLRIPGDIITCKLEWPDAKLLEMLEGRMRDKDGRRIYFNQLFDENTGYANPAKVLVEAAKGSPRRLIRIGNRLLEVHVSQKPIPETLSYHSLERAIAQVDAES